ncbi:VC0807 family protein [Crenobacter sp. SG2303]|uniref:VC0807 family protein n=1 Tax=Crenobacter oryzisoli TaxID=3056844 RepID=A0ABT7XS61_9NEIS|nr:VC0807 family protein [Crenobacter sp. SG2303]MDN0076637.1 VC0807 family protein [Crenobacter sp. SG2303]
MSKRLVFVLDLIVNLALPWLAYKLTVDRFGEFGGLVASAIPPMLWSLVELARFRRLDPISALALGGIALSLLGLVLGGSPRLLLLRESLLSGVIGLVFLVSLLFRQPLIYHLAHATLRREGGDRADELQRRWQDNPVMRRALRMMTLAWGMGLTGETALRSWMAWNWSSERFLAVSPLIGYGIYGGLMLWTFWYRRQLSHLRAAPLPSQTA